MKDIKEKPTGRVLKSNVTGKIPKAALKKAWTEAKEKSRTKLRESTAAQGESDYATAQDKLILRVPIIKIFQIDSSHRKILHFSLFGVGRKRNGVTAENGTAPRDTLSRSLESKMRLRDTRPHKRTKIYYRLCTV